MIFAHLGCCFLFLVKVPAAIGKRNANLPSLGVGGTRNFLGCGILAVFFCFGKRLMDFFGLRSDFCQVYCFFVSMFDSQHRNLHPPKVGWTQEPVGGQQLVIGQWLQGVPPPPSPLGPASDLNTLARMQETCKFWNSKSFRLLLLSFSGPRKVILCITDLWPHRPFHCLISLWTQEMEQENAQLRERYSQMQMQAVSVVSWLPVLPRHFWVGNPCRSRNWPTRGRNWPNSWTRHPEILKLVEVCRSFLNKNCDGKQKTFDQRSGACRILYVLYLCLYVCMLGLCICHKRWSKGFVFRQIWIKTSIASCVPPGSTDFEGPDSAIRGAVPW